MADATHERARWLALVEREACGEALSAEERAFCEDFAARDEEAARETALLTELERLDAVPDAQSRALVDRTLAALAAEERSREAQTVSHMRGTRERTVIVLVGGATLAAAAAIAIAVLRAPTAPEPVAAPASPPARIELVYASGDVRIDGAVPEGGASLLAEGATLAVGDGAACLALDPGIDVCLGAQSKLQLARTRSPWRRLDLVEGTVGVQLAHQPDAMRLSIVADGVWTTAVGTAFTVARADDGIRATVLDGTVELGHDGGAKQLVTAHQRADVRGGASRVTALTRAEESSEWALLRPAVLWREPVSATLDLRGAPGTEVVLDGERIGHTPLTTLVPVGRHHLALRVDGNVAFEHSFVAQAGRTVDVGVDWTALSAERAPPSEPQALGDETAPRTLAGARAPRAAHTPAIALQEARAMMRAGRYADAAARYEALNREFPESLEARTVLVPLAQLELDRLGRPERALVHAEHYLQDGQGALAEEARFARIRALAALGQTRQEITAIEEFLELHRSSLRAHRLEERLRELGRER